MRAQGWQAGACRALVRLFLQAAPSCVQGGPQRAPCTIPRMESGSACILVDAHVHVHRADEAGAMFDAAWCNFDSAARSLGIPCWTGVLMLAEMNDAAWFEAMAAQRGALVDGWNVLPDPVDGLLLRACRAHRELLLVAGRQVATREGVEVLALATRSLFRDGDTLEDILQQAAVRRALPVLPWGAGKWTGRRRRLVRDALARQAPPVWAGDSGGRPAPWSARAEFELARQQGRPLVSGSDPLPLQGEILRVGSFGCWLSAALPPTHPATWLRERLRAATPEELHPYGAAQAIGRFARNQASLRFARCGHTRRIPAAVPAASLHARMPQEWPDVETSSADYARRFSGRAGRYLLDTQSRSIERILRGMPPGRALDVGGGHGQLVDLLHRLGWEVTVHGTDPACARNLREVHGKRDVRFVVGDLFDLPVATGGFELVIAVRLISHVEDWPRLVAELCRVASRAVIVDYPSRGGLNALTPLLFGLKKALEGNTRTYTRFSRAQLQQAFAAHGFGAPRQVRQFFLPMVAHRMGGGAAPLRLAESLCRVTGLTALAGSPVILRMDRRR